MRTRIALLVVAALSLESALITAAQQAEPTAPNPVMVTIDTAKTAEPASKYEFGLPWVSANHLHGITGLEEYDPALFKKLSTRPEAKP
jgi:hypothetical protein